MTQNVQLFTDLLQTSFQSQVLSCARITGKCDVIGTGRPIEQPAQLTLLGSNEQYFNKAFLSSFCIVNKLKMIRVTGEDGR